MTKKELYDEILTLKSIISRFDEKLKEKSTTESIYKRKINSLEYGNEKLQTSLYNIQEILIEQKIVDGKYHDANGYLISKKKYYLDKEFEITRGIEQCNEMIRRIGNTDYRPDAKNQVSHFKKQIFELEHELKEIRKEKEEHLI